MMPWKTRSVFPTDCRTETDLDKALALYLEDRMVRTSRVVIDSTRAFDRW